MLTRFAPSPTGRLHLGHAFSALTVWRVAETLGGTALLRIEDTDSTRCRPEFEAAIYEDLRWLGLDWPAPVRRQSDHTADYQTVIEKLTAMGLVYPCSCSRRDMAEAGAAPGWDGPVYPGTCRHRAMTDRAPDDAIRLNLSATLDTLGEMPVFVETGRLTPGEHRPDADDLRSNSGDPVLIRRLTGDPAYHLACLHDDEAQGITHVVRGADVWRLTFLHVVIQRLMGWGTPLYHHHDLIRDDAGKRLAKITSAKSIASYREAGLGPKDIRGLVGL